MGAAVGAVVPPRRCGIGGEFMRMAAAPLYIGMNYDQVSDLWPDGPAVFFVLVGILVNQVALSQPNSWMDRLEDKVDWVNRLIHCEVREMLKRNTR